ncbi:MAG: S-adenosylmethionine:tRNA ribosyltransferase-isomerase, partial [Actinomycetota bacterium]|nr:S-adenosylmethionine:tRNA ribosyltransferase-isomerase [Actinomycetota bacterium]
MTALEQRRRLVVPAGQPADSPPEERGLPRDGVRLLVARPGGVEHRTFVDLPDLLDPGDLVVVNTSTTLPAALTARRAGGATAPLHVAPPLDDGTWVVELRTPDNTGPDHDLRPGDVLALAGGVTLRVVAGHPRPDRAGSRLWRAAPAPPTPVVPFLQRHGRPVRYGHAQRSWPLRLFQNVYADPHHVGSAEMASAGRPLTERVLVHLLRNGVRVAPVVLHAGLSSPEAHEPPAPERFVVPEPTAA